MPFSWLVFKKEREKSNHTDRYVLLFSQNTYSLVDADEDMFAKLLWRRPRGDVWNFKKEETTAARSRTLYGRNDRSVFLI